MQAGSLLFFQALTSLHPGSGSGIGVVDLPVQRERHTGWPVIPGSSVKGVLRETTREAMPADRWLAAFGPESPNAAEHAGALSFTEARVVAFPVRSLVGVFAWVTCPSALGRLLRDAGLVGLPRFRVPSDPGPDHVLVADKSPLRQADQVVLEEFAFHVTGNAQEAALWLARHLPDREGDKRFVERFAVVSDDAFTHFVRHGTEVMARIGLDAETRTVRGGALFYQEFLPPETLLCTVVLADASRRPDVNATAQEVLGSLRERLPKVVQIGGEATTGKGLCAVSLTAADGGGR